jgi:PilZ domain
MTEYEQPATKIHIRRDRFVIMAPASFSWRSRDGIFHRAEGTARDISSHGVFICTHQMPAAGAVVEVDVTVGLSGAKGTITRLKGTGTVVRINTTDDQTAGFAAAVNFAIADMQVTSNP